MVERCTSDCNDPNNGYQYWGNCAVHRHLYYEAVTEFLAEQERKAQGQVYMKVKVNLRDKKQNGTAGQLRKDKDGRWHMTSLVTDGEQPSHSRSAPATSLEELMQIKNNLDESISIYTGMLTGGGDVDKITSDLEEKCNLKCDSNEIQPSTSTEGLTKSAKKRLKQKRNLLERIHAGGEEAPGIDRISSDLQEPSTSASTESMTKSAKKRLRMKKNLLERIHTGGQEAPEIDRISSDLQENSNLNCDSNENQPSISTSTETLTKSAKKRLRQKKNLLEGIHTGGREASNIDSNGSQPSSSTPSSEEVAQSNNLVGDICTGEAEGEAADVDKISLDLQGKCNENQTSTSTEPLTKSAKKRLRQKRNLLERIHTGGQGAPEVDRISSRLQEKCNENQPSISTEGLSKSAKKRLRMKRKLLEGIQTGGHAPDIDAILSDLQEKCNLVENEPSSSTPSLEELLFQNNNLARESCTGGVEGGDSDKISSDLGGKCNLKWYYSTCLRKTVLKINHGRSICKLAGEEPVVDKSPFGGENLKWLQRNYYFVRGDCCSRTREGPNINGALHRHLIQSTQERIKYRFENYNKFLKFLKITKKEQYQLRNIMLQSFEKEFLGNSLAIPYLLGVSMESLLKEIQPVKKELLNLHQKLKMRGKRVKELTKTVREPPRIRKAAATAPKEGKRKYSTVVPSVVWDLRRPYIEELDVFKLKCEWKRVKSEITSGLHKAELEFRTICAEHGVTRLHATVPRRTKSLRVPYSLRDDYKELRSKVVLESEAEEEEDSVEVTNFNDDDKHIDDDYANASNSNVVIPRTIQEQGIQVEGLASRLFSSLL